MYFNVPWGFGEAFVQEQYFAERQISLFILRPDNIPNLCRIKL